MNRAIDVIDSHRSELSRKQYKTLRGQAYSGNNEGALKGLETCLKKNRRLAENRAFHEAAYRKRYGGKDNDKN